MLKVQQTYKTHHEKHYCTATSANHLTNLYQTYGVNSDGVVQEVTGVWYLFEDLYHTECLSWQLNPFSFSIYG